MTALSPVRRPCAVAARAVLAKCPNFTPSESHSYTYLEEHLLVLWFSVAVRVVATQPAATKKFELA